MSCDAFEGAGDGGASGDDFTALLASRVNAVSGFLSEVVVLRVHFVVFDEFSFDGAKGADTDVESQEGVVDVGKDFWGEVKSSGGSGDGSFFACKGGLVAVAIGGLIFAVHVMGEGEVTVLFFIEFVIPTDDAVAIF